MDTEMKRHLADSIREFHLPRYDQIPDVGLYLEQTTKYINGYLAPLGCMELTASMVSNYVKKGLIPAPVKKQYSAQHIAYLFYRLIDAALGRKLRQFKIELFKSSIDIHTVIPPER